MVTPRKRIKKEAPLPDESGEVMAAVTETIKTKTGEQTLDYEIPLKEIKGDSPNSQDFSDEPEDSTFEFEDYDAEVFEEIPKSEIDVMFDRLLEVDSTGFRTFYAQVTRLPDTMSDNFNVRCNLQTFLGTQGFSIRDRFIFISALQTLNNESGGHLTIGVYDESGKEIMLERVRNFHKSYHHIGIANLLIPNPVKELKVETPQSQNQNSNDDKLLAFMQQSENRFNLLFEKMNQKPEQSDIEKQIMQAALNKLLNPEPPQQNSTEKIIESALSGAAAVGAIGEAFAKNINREPAPAPEKTWLEQANELGNSPLGEKLTNGVFNLAAIIASKNMQNVPLVPPQNNQPAPPPPNVIGEQQNPAEAEEDLSLLDRILNELESTNEINAENETIKQLSIQFPEQSAQIKDLCKGLDFNAVVSLIKMQAPDIFADYMDRQMIDGKPEDVLTDVGEYVMKRFETFYNFVREQE